MPNIRFDQGDTGTVNRSRSDITISVEVDVFALGIVGTAIFGLLARPVGSAAAFSGVGNDRQITPDVAGKYRCRIIDDNDDSFVIHTFTVRTAMRGLQKPAFNERASDDANDVDTDPGSWVNDSETNEGGVFTGWNPEVQELIDSLDRVSNLAAVNPTVNDDAADGYVVGAIWVNSATVRAFVLLDATSTAAVWKEILTTPSDNAIVQMRRTTTFAFPLTWQDVTFDTTDEETDTAVLEHDNTNTERLIFNRAGAYRISYEVGFDMPTNDDNEARLFLNDTSVVAGSFNTIFDGTAFDRINLSRTIVVQIDTPGDFITLQIQNVGNGGTLAVDTILVANALQGAAGPAGPAGGGNTFTLDWRWSTDTTATDPGSGVIKGNNATQASITNLYVDDITDGGKNVDVVLADMSEGDIVVVTEVDDNSRWFIAELSGAPVDNTGWWTLPVTVVQNGTAVRNNRLQAVQIFSFGGSAGGGFPDVQIFADMFEPVNADWPITVLAPAVKLGSTSRVEISFDDTTESAVGFQIRVPDGAANMVMEVISRAQTAPGAAQVARYNVRESGSPDNAADDAFSAPFQYPDIDIPTNAFRQYDEVTRTLAAWGIVAGQVHQFCLSRDTGDAADTLVGNLLLLGVFIRFT